MKKHFCVPTGLSCKNNPSKVCTYIYSALYLEKESLIASLQEELENATSSEVTRMSCHEEAAAILPMHSMTADDNHNHDENDNMQEMHQVHLLP